MKKQLLEEYADACELLRETEEDLAGLERDRQGLIIHITDEQLYEKQLLIQRKALAEKIKLEVEAWMNTIPLRMQRIIRFRFFLGYTWKDTADHIKGRATENGIKKEFERFLEK